VQVPVPLVALFLACRLPSFICVVVPFVVYTLTRSLPNPTSNTFAQQSTMRSSTMFAALAASLTVRAADIDMEGLPNTGLDTSAWVTGQNPPIDDMVDANDFQFAAKNKLDGRRYAYYRTAALDEITYERNMHDWEKVRMNGFAFNDVSNLNRKTKILGHEFDSPFFIAPAAEAGYTDPDAERNLARAAGDANVLYVPSVSSTLSIEEIAAAGRDNQIMFHQEYIWEDRDRLQDELDRMKNSGFRAIFLTTDNTGVEGVRLATTASGLLLAPATPPTPASKP
jgi:hypothetical protein